MAEQYATHLRLNNDPNWYRILAFQGPNERYAPNWLIAKTAFDAGAGEVAYSNTEWVVHDQTESFKILIEEEQIVLEVEEPE